MHKLVLIIYKSFFYSKALNITKKIWFVMGSRQYSKRIPMRTYIRVKVHRPKTFKTEEAAKAWAASKGIKSYELVNLKSTESRIKKIKVVVK